MSIFDVVHVFVEDAILGADPQFDKLGVNPVHDWRRHIPERVREIWSTFSLEQRKALIESADDATSQTLRRKHRPDLAIKDDVETYLQHFSKAKTVAEKKALIEASYGKLGKDSFDHIAFCVAISKACRAAALHELRDSIFTRSVSLIVDALHCELPHFCYATRSGNVSYGQHFVVYPLMEDDILRSDSDENRIIALRSRYAKILKPYKMLLAFIRYEAFRRIAVYHHTTFLSQAKKAIEQWKGCQTDIKAGSIIQPLFGGYVDQYDDFCYFNKSYLINIKKRNKEAYTPVDGITILSDILRGQRDETGYKKRPRKVPKYKKTTKKLKNVAPNPMVTLLGIEEYELFMRGQILKIYDILRKDPTINVHFQNVMREWYKRDGIKHRRLVKENPDYNNIGDL
jgi:hypothetical protein